MRSWILSVSLAAFPVLTVAEDVAVYSGQHADFTRITLVYDEATNWSVNPLSDRFEVFLGRTELLVNLDKVFERISGKRISSVEYDAGSGLLSVFSNCACYLRVLEVANNTIALDVVDGSSPATDAVPVFNRRPHELDSTIVREPLLRLPYMAPRSLDLAISEFPLVDNAGFHNNQESISSQVFSVGGESPSSFDLANGLLERVGSTAATGLIELNEVHTSQSLASDRHLGAHVNLVGANDVDDGVKLNSDDVCEIGEALAFFSFNDSSDYSVVAQLRAASFDENMTVQIQEIQSLTHAYLRMGMGAEARALADAYLVEDNTSMLREIAVFLEGGVDEAWPRGIDLTHCDNNAAMWSLLFGFGRGSSDGVNSKSIVRTFRELPVELRLIVAEPLYVTLSQLNFLDDAQSVSNAVAPLLISSGNGGESLDVIGSIDFWSSSDEGLLRRVVSENSQMSPIAMVRLLEMLVESKSAPTTEDIDLALSFSGQAESSYVAMDLVRLSSLALIDRGDFLKARMVLEMAGLSEQLTSNVWSETLPLLVASALSEDVEPEAFLTLLDEWNVFSGLQHLDSRVVSSLGERLIELGLYELFGVLESELSDRLDDEAITERSFLRAKLALQTGDGALAMALLQERDGVRFLELRAESEMLMREYEDAARTFLLLGDPDAAFGAAIRSEDEEFFATFVSEEVDLINEVKNTNIRSLIAEIQEFSQVAADSFGADDSLSGGRRLVEQSSELRSRIDSLWTPLPEVVR